MEYVLYMKYLWHKRFVNETNSSYFSPFNRPRKILQYWNSSYIYFLSFFSPFFSSFSFLSFSLRLIHKCVASHKWYKAFDTECSEWKGSIVGIDKLVAKWSYPSPYSAVLIDHRSPFCPSQYYGLTTTRFYKVSYSLLCV